MRGKTEFSTLLDQEQALEGSRKIVRNRAQQIQLVHKQDTILVPQPVLDGIGIDVVFVAKPAPVQRSLLSSRKTNPVSKLLFRVLEVWLQEEWGVIVK